MVHNHRGLERVVHPMDLEMVVLDLEMTVLDLLCLSFRDFVIIQVVSVRAHIR